MKFYERPLCYLAGPYSNPDPVENTHIAVKTADNLHASGLVTCIVPHLTMIWHAISPKELDFWYEYDLSMLARCDAMYRMPGKSTGADKEVEFAMAHKIPVFYAPDVLLAWVPRP